MAGRAGTLAAAVGIDARHGIVNRAAHQREADRNLHLMLGSVMFDIRNLGHEAYGNNCSPVSASSTKIALTGQFSAASSIFSTVSASGSTASDWRFSFSRNTFGAMVSHMALPTQTSWSTQTRSLRATLAS